MFYQIHERKNKEQDILQQKLESVQVAAEKEKDMLQVQYSCIMYVYALNFNPNRGDVMDVA